MQTSTVWSDVDDVLLLMDQLQEGVLVLDQERIVFANPAAHEMLGYGGGLLLGRPFLSMIAPESREAVTERHQMVLKAGRACEMQEAMVLQADQETRIPVQLRICRGRGAAFFTMKDLRAERQVSNEVRALQEELAQIIRKLPDIYYRTDMRGVLVRLSPSVTSVLGYDIEEVLGTPITDYYVNAEDRTAVVQQILAANGEVTRVEGALRHKDGHAIWFSTNAFLVKDASGKPIGIEGLARDDTRRRKLEQELFRLSQVDALTGLCNRHHVLYRAEEEYQRAVRYGRAFTVLALDLDHFKSINDRFGHHAGDEALRFFARTSMESLRDSDIMGRVGGEEFLVCLPETDTQEGIVVAGRIADSLRRGENNLAHLGVHFTVSVGVASRVPGDRSAEDVQIRADRALYEAKNAGRDCIRIAPVA